MIGFLERLLGAFAAGSDGLGVVLNVRARGVHVEQLWAFLVDAGKENGYSKRPEERSFLS